MAPPPPADRCSLDMHARFSAFARELEAARGSAAARALPPTTRVAPCSPAARAPRFETLPRSEGKLDRQAAAARLNADAVRSPFREPAAHAFRSPEPARWRDGRDFVAKFPLPSRQDQRSRTARAQEGFFGPAPGEDAPPVSHSFREQVLQQQQQRPSPTRSPLDQPPRSPDAFSVAFRAAPEQQAPWPTG